MQAVISIFANYSTILFVLFGIYIYKHILSKRKKKEKKKKQEMIF